MRVIGFMVCGPGEADRYLLHTLNTFKRLCDDAIIVLNNADERTIEAIVASGYWAYRDDREWGKYQPQIKTELLKKAALLKPDWILPLDADETFREDFTRKELNALCETKALGFYFYIVNLWNDETHYWKQGSFWNVRLYRFAPEYGLEFAKKNVHCGLAPPYAYTFGRYAPHLVKHRGLQRESDRAAKVERYKKYDPREEKIGIGAYYEAIKGTGSGDLFDEEAVQKKVEAEVQKMKQDYDKSFDMSNTIKKYVYVRRQDGVILDIPASHLEAHLKRGFEFVSEINYDIDRKKIDVPVIDDESRENEPRPTGGIVAQMSSQFQCPLCGYAATSGPDLEEHKYGAHGRAQTTRCAICAYTAPSPELVEMHKKSTHQ